MASADVSLQLETQDRIRFAHSPLKAFFFALISVVFMLLCWFSIRDAEMIRYGFTAFSLLFVIVGILGVFWRSEIDIDLVRRRVRQIRGMWPNPKVTLRNLDDADGIWLSIEYRSSGSKKGSKRKVPWWFVSLKFPDEKTGTRLFATRREVEGYQKWEHYANRLEVTAVDGTAEVAARKDWTKLDENVAVQTANDKAPATPRKPPKSRVEVITQGTHREFVLPPLGFSGGLIFLALFGGAFVVMGGGAVLAKLGVIGMQIQGSEAAILMVPPIFVLAGLGIIWLGIKGSYSSLVLGVEGRELYTERLAFGKRSGRETILLAAIESIDVADDVRSRRRDGGYIKIGGVSVGTNRYRARESEIVLRSDQKILRFGESLSTAEQEWLADVCRFAVHHLRLP
jgi:hypothetical protein